MISSPTNYWLTQQSFYRLYLLLVSATGAGLLAWSVSQLPQDGYWTDFLLLTFLTLLAMALASSMAIGDAGITYAVDAVVCFAVLPVFGPGAAVVIKTLSFITLWLIKPRAETTWKKSWGQLAFNIGMHNIALVLAAAVLIPLRNWLGADTLAGQTLPWLPAAIVYEQVNLWMLIGILYLQQGAPINPRGIFREELWATQLMVVIYTIGGSLLAYAIINYDRLGIVIFFLPILVSSYAFRLYVRQMQSHMQNLEQLIADRTSELTTKTAELTERTKELTERTKELTERTKELEDINTEKDAFLAVLTHDMMTPLSNIRYCTDMLQAEPDTGPVVQKLASWILRSQSTLFHMVRNIVDIETVRRGERFPAHMQNCDLQELIQEVAEATRPTAESKQIDLYIEVSDLPIVAVDPEQITRILNNLLSNAIKYTQNEGTIWLRAYPIGTPESPEHIRITVRDTGYGIAPENRESIFEHYVRSPHHQDKAIGAGLGLAITKALVEGYDGTISVESTVGKGSTFTVDLPAKERLSQIVTTEY